MPPLSTTPENAKWLQDVTLTAQRTKQIEEEKKKKSKLLLYIGGGLLLILIIILLTYKPKK